MTLDIITSGTATPAEARSALSQAFEGLDERLARCVYGALRAWVWKALDGRRRDDELREWHDILKRAEAFVAARHAAQGERIGVLCDLLYESISVSETKSVDLVLRRQHVRDIVLMLHGSPDGSAQRGQVGRQMGLQQGNLTRVLNMMAAARLVERTSEGRQAAYQLTTQGRDVAAKLEATRRTAHDAVRPVLGTGTVIQGIGLPSDGLKARDDFYKQWRAAMEKARGKGLERASVGEFVVIAARRLSSQAMEPQVGHPQAVEATGLSTRSMFDMGSLIRDVERDPSPLFEQGRAPSRIRTGQGMADVA